MKIHISIPPESSEVQRLNSEIKLYTDKFFSMRRTLVIRCIHLFFVFFMMIFFFFVLHTWEKKWYWFSYNFSNAVYWIFSVSLATRVAWGICANVVLIREWRSLSTPASTSEEQNLLEVDPKDKEKIQKDSILLDDWRKFYGKHLRRVCLLETLATFFFSAILCYIVSMKLADCGIIPWRISDLIRHGLDYISCLVLISVGFYFWKYWWKKRGTV